MDFHEELSVYTKKAEEIIRGYLPVEEGKARHLLEAVNYSMTAGGKRLRPVLMLASFEMFGGKTNVVCPFMAAIEMIHTHSLIHDDLPAMDNDEYRRGKKTTHVVYGEAAAILAGDALLNLAYETAAGAFSEFPGEHERIMKALKILSRKTGIYGMIGGQSVDVEMEGKPLDASLLDFIYRMKTGALLEASLMIGAVLAGAGEKETEAMRQVGIRIGTAFQIRDDILDICGDEKEIGKPVGSDRKNGKTTYASLFGFEKADADVRDLTAQAVAILEETGYRHPFLTELLTSLTERRF